MDIFNNYPKKIYISRDVYCVQHDFIKNKKEHIDKLKKYSNAKNKNRAIINDIIFKLSLIKKYQRYLRQLKDS